MTNLTDSINFTIIEDTRQQDKKHELKREYFEEMGVKIIRSKLPIGDYANLRDMSLVIDTKRDIQEVIQNVTKDHERFRAECVLAQESGIRLVVLIENKQGVCELSDLKKWYNWRLKKNRYATTGRQLEKILRTMTEKYDVTFMFCSPDEAGFQVLKLLGYPFD